MTRNVMYQITRKCHLHYARSASHRRICKVCKSYCSAVPCTSSYECNISVCSFVGIILSDAEGVCDVAFFNQLIRLILWDYSYINIDLFLYHIFGHIKKMPGFV